MSGAAGPPPVRTERAAHFRDLTLGIIPLGLELIDACDAAHGVESRHPFFDPRLAEFCLALPPAQKLDGGLTRLVVRRALAGVLPPEVRDRGDKSNLAENFHRSLLRDQRPQLEAVILHDASAIEEFVDVPALRAAYDDYASGRDPGQAAPVWRAVTLAMWLRRAGFAAPARA